MFQNVTSEPQLHVSECDFRDLSCMFQNVTSEPQLHVSECDFRDLSCMFQNVTSGTSVACFRM